MKRPEESPIIIVAAATFAAVIAAVIMFWRQKKGKAYKNCSLVEVATPTKWTKVGEVVELILYPLKGAKRKCITEAQCTKRGLMENDSKKLSLQDRMFIVYNDKHEFLNIKKNSKMLFVETVSLDESSVRFSFPDAKDLIVKTPDENFPLTHIDFYLGETLKTADCGDEAAGWFSQNLIKEPKGLRLGCSVNSPFLARSISSCSLDKYTEAYPKLHSDYMGTYADIASYMLMSEESLKDLNNRLNKPVSEHHFRPNIVVKGSPAFSEDTWDWVRVGDNVVLRSFKYCTRCVVTSVNPDTAEKDPTTEPLRTLRAYRQVKEPLLKKLEGNNPVMGLYIGCHEPGLIRVGDPVYISSE